jgi:hypothetical protein
MAYYQDVREYLKALEEHGKLVRITRAINKDTARCIRWCGYNTAACRKRSVELFFLKA